MGPARSVRHVIVALVVMLGVLAGLRSTSSATSLSIAVNGNHFVNGAGATVRVLGVNVPSTEYACDQGWGYAGMPLTVASAEAVARWHANAVRVPLNEDCWLGLNGQPSYGTMAGYRQAMESWVSDLHAAGLYAVIDLHWTAPGAHDADGQRPMPDDHSVAFWTSVAGAFASDHAVLFDAFNEPYSPAANGNSSLTVSWSCWLDGGCKVPVANQDGTIDDSDTYSAVGMQAIVDGIRATGASQPILLGGLSYANDLTGWLTHEPTDPDHQLAASFHNYFGESCDSASCWNTAIAGVATHVPVVTGEFDQGFDCAGPPTAPTSLTTFDTTYMTWADAHGVSYLAWGWWVLGNTTTRCSALGGGADNYALVSNDAGTPVAPDGANLRTHLAQLFATTAFGVRTTTLPAATVGVSYKASLSASGGNVPYHWSVVSGHLPRGLHLKATGVIAGKAKTPGTAAFTVRVVDHKTKTKPPTQHSAQKTLSITVH